MKPSFSVEELYEDVIRLQSKYSEDKILYSSISKVASNLIKVSSTSSLTLPDITAAFDTKFRAKFTALKTEFPDPEIDTHATNILSAANIQDKLRIYYDEFSTSGRTDSSQFLRTVNNFAEYAAEFIIAGFYTKNSDKLTSALQMLFKDLASRISRIKGSVPAQLTRDFERIVADEFDVLVESIYTAAHITAVNEHYNAIKNYLKSNIQQVLINLMPNFDKYVQYINNNIEKLEYSHDAFMNLYNTVKEHLGGAPALDTGAFSSSKKLMFKTSVDAPPDPIDDLPEEAPPEVETFNHAGEDPEVLEQFLKDFDQSGESMILLDFLGQAIIDSATSSAHASNPKNADAYSQYASNYIFNRIKNHSGNSYSKLLLTMTIMYHLSN